MSTKKKKKKKNNRRLILAPIILILIVAVVGGVGVLATAGRVQIQCNDGKGGCQNDGQFVLRYGRYRSKRTPL